MATGPRCGRPLGRSSRRGPWLLPGAAGAALLTVTCQTAPAERAGGVPALDVVSAYACSDGGNLWVERTPGRARVFRQAAPAVTLPDRSPESGLWYADDRWELRGEASELTFGRVGEDAVVCRPAP